MTQQATMMNNFIETTADMSDEQVMNMMEEQFMTTDEKIKKYIKVTDELNDEEFQEYIEALWVNSDDRTYADKIIKGIIDDRMVKIDDLIDRDGYRRWIADDEEVYNDFKRDWYDEYEWFFIKHPTFDFE